MSTNSVVQRSDVHRPSAINPDDYQFVAYECLKIENPGDVEILRAERERLRAHMARTGGTYSAHAHGGNCHICGSVNAVYTVLFYHAPSNSYVRTGQDCAEKLDSGLAASAFRASLRTAMEHQAGKAKAQAILADLGMGVAWTIYIGDYSGHSDDGVVRDMVGKLVKYGSLSEKQNAYLGKLLTRIAERPAREAERKAERDTAQPAPVTNERIKICGTVVSTKSVETSFGISHKCLIRTSAGWMAFGTCPSGAERGAELEFFARLEVSKDDLKFAYFSRPTRVVITKTTVDAA